MYSQYCLSSIVPAYYDVNGTSALDRLNMKLCTCLNLATAFPNCFAEAFFFEKRNFRCSIYCVHAYAVNIAENKASALTSFGYTIVYNTGGTKILSYFGKFYGTALFHVLAFKAKPSILYFVALRLCPQLYS